MHSYILTEQTPQQIVLITPIVATRSLMLGTAASLADSRIVIQMSPRARDVTHTLQLENAEAILCSAPA